MKMKNLKQEKPQTLKKRLMSALVMLLISTLMMSTTTFAWFVLSTAPEVTGIETQVGANGSLEIALLNKDTRANMSTIRAGLGGGSLQENKRSANDAWGNLIDLSYSEYGLGDLVLLPARLDVTANGSDYMVDVNKLLAVPSYGYDGRIIELTRDTASAIYQKNNFMYSGAQDYGVRAIGTSDALSAQGSALSSAKTNIATWTKSAKSGAQAALTNNMDGLFTIIMGYAMDSSNATFDDTNKATMDAMLNDLEAVLNYLDSSLRQGLVAYLASELGDELAFTTARDKVLNSDNALTSLLEEVEADLGAFSEWVDQLAAMQNKHGLAKAASAELNDGEYTWTEIKGVLANIMNMDALLINGSTIDKLDVNSLMVQSVIEMTLAPGSGLFADVADFTDNYSITTKYSGKDVEMATASAVKPAYLTALSAAVNTLEPADGGDTASALPLTATYGYAIDLAFRCNAAQPDLVLQTKGVQRLYSGSEDGEAATSDSGSLQGGGSYMEFSSKDDSFTLEQRLALMDAIRVAFVDDQGMILGIAKLNVTSREVDADGLIKAPLYLYEYTFEKDELTNGMILTMGERKLIDNQITELEQNIAKAVTAVVWLDGDLVDNTMVAAEAATSLDGVLNLQFATSAELIPAVDNYVLNYSADKADLQTAMDLVEEIVEAGQGTYTNVSWTEFINAYRRAEDVNSNPYASHIEVYNAAKALGEAYPKLMEVSLDALNAKIYEVRKLTGTGTVTGAYVLDMGKDGYVALTEFTSAQLDSNVGVVMEVGDNLAYEGNGVYTPVYTDATWNALANALYQAEAVAMNEKSTDDQIESAISALDEAEKALEFAVYYIPYEYNGDLYYMARSEYAAEDTYGRWYDANRKRIVEDVKILKLDAYAKEVTLVQMAQQEIITTEFDYITPDISFLTEVFPSLRDVEVKAVQWEPMDSYLFFEEMNGSHYERMVQLLADVEYLENIYDYDYNSYHVYCAERAQSLKERYEDPEYGIEVEIVHANEAEIAISELETCVKDVYRIVYQLDDSYMTNDMRIMLTKALNNAYAIVGYETIDGLQEATAEAEDVLGNTDATNGDAAEVLDKLNEYLTVAVTQYNTLVSKLPGFDSNNIVYEVDYPGITLRLTGETGSVTLGATVLTTDGVVTRVSKTITVYDKAEGVFAYDSAEVDPYEVLMDEADPTTEVNVKIGETYDLNTMMIYRDVLPSGDIEIGYYDEEPITRYTWASNNLGIATVTGNGMATITGVAKGRTSVSLVVETACGNSYTCSVWVNVTE